MTPELAAQLRQIRNHTLDYDECLFLLARLTMEVLDASQSMIALWDSNVSGDDAWTAWTASGAKVKGKVISRLGGSFSLLNAARVRKQLLHEPVRIQDITKSLSTGMHDICYGMAFPLRHGDILTQSVIFSGAFYVDRRRSSANFTAADHALANELSMQVEGIVAIIHLQRLVAAGLPDEPSKTQMRPVMQQKIEQYRGNVSRMLKDNDLIRMHAGGSSALFGPDQLKALVGQVGLTPLLLRLQKREKDPTFQWEKIQAAVGANGTLEQAAVALDLEADTLRKRKQRLKKKLGLSEKLQT